MKKAIAIIVLGLLWCNVGFAATYKLERCYINNVTPAKFIKEFGIPVHDKFEPNFYEKYEIEINSDSKTVKRYWSVKKQYRFGYDTDSNYSGEGEKISKIFKGSPLKKAKIKRKDIILAYNGIRMNSLNDLINFWNDYAGGPVEITFKRKKKIKTAMVYPNVIESKSMLSVYDLSFYDSRSAEAKLQTHPDWDQMKINIEDGRVINGVVISQTESVQYYIQCSKDSKPEKSVELVTLIKEAKNTCKELGFKEGTEKFAECGLKLYTKNIDKISEKKDVVIVQSPQTTSTSNTMTIYDPVRDNRALINQGMKMLSGRCTLGIDC